MRGQSYTTVIENIFVAGGWLAGLTLACSVTSYLHKNVEISLKSEQVLMIL